MKLDKRNIDWVWVDLDDTIWDFKANSWEALAHVYEYAHLETAFGDVDTWRNLYQENNHRLWSLYNVGKITKEYLMVERFRKVLADAGYENEVAIKMSAELSDVYLDKLASLKTLVPGARELLNYLKSQGYKIGVISNGFYEVQHRKMVSSDIVEYFDAVVGGDMVELGKPNPHIFWKAADLLGVSYGDCLVVGDTPADVKAGTAAGMQVLLIPDQVPANAETTALSLAVLPQIDRMLELL
jgi:putative hydrolase of the HAD superfamily